MRSTVIVLGAGRSGTSLVAGLLADAGYHPGDRLLPPGPGNPCGYFEDADVNELNDELLAPWLPLADPPVPRRLAWLAALPASAAPQADAGQRRRMRAHLARRPVCLKDPRFSTTIDAWREELPADAAVVCVFRDPARVIESIMREIRRDSAYFAGLPPDAASLFRVWSTTYRRLLARMPGDESWLWVDADALVENRDVSGLSDLAGVRLEARRIDPALRRSRSVAHPPRDVALLHARLRCLAHPPLSPNRWVLIPR